MGLAGPLLRDSGTLVLLAVLILAYVVTVMGVGGLSVRDLRFLREKMV